MNELTIMTLRKILTLSAFMLLGCVAPGYALDFKDGAAAIRTTAAGVKAARLKQREFAVISRWEQKVPASVNGVFLKAVSSLGLKVKDMSKSYSCCWLQKGDEKLVFIKVQKIDAQDGESNLVSETINASGDSVKLLQKYKVVPSPKNKDASYYYFGVKEKRSRIFDANGMVQNREWSNPNLYLFYLSDKPVDEILSLASTKWEGSAKYGTDDCQKFTSQINGFKCEFLIDPQHDFVLRQATIFNNPTSGDFVPAYFFEVPALLQVNKSWLPQKATMQGWFYVGKTKEVPRAKEMLAQIPDQVVEKDGHLLLRAIEQTYQLQEAEAPELLRDLVKFDWPEGTHVQNR